MPRTVRQNHPLVVLDGPDGAGKTTLAKRLARFGYRHIHLTYRFKDQMHRYHTAALELGLKYTVDQPLVLDRWWPSEEIYAQVFRGGSPWPMMGRLLDRVALKHGLLYVICLPQDRDLYLAHFNALKGERVEMYDTMAAVYDSFHELWLRLKHRHDVLRYDFMANDSDADVHINNHAHYLRLMRPHFALDISERTVAGNLSRMGQHFSAKVILVGEQGNPKGRREVWPFFEYGNSSLWLTRALEEVGFKEPDLIMVNSLRNDGSPNDAILRELAGKWGEDRLVPMGTVAEAAVGRILGRSAKFTMRHPQHTRRFSPNDLSAYYMLWDYVNNLGEAS